MALNYVRIMVVSSVLANIVAIPTHTHHRLKLALNSGLWVRPLLIGGSPFQGWCPASEVNDKGCPGEPDHLSLSLKGRVRLKGGGKGRDTVDVAKPHDVATLVFYA